jgi:hypothetical protein
MHSCRVGAKNRKYPIFGPQTAIDPPISTPVQPRYGSGTDIVYPGAIFCVAGRWKKVAMNMPGRDHCKLWDFSGLNPQLINNHQFSSLYRTFTFSIANADRQNFKKTRLPGETTASKYACL